MYFSLFHQLYIGKQKTFSPVEMSVYVGDALKWFEIKQSVSPIQTTHRNDPSGVPKCSTQGKTTQKNREFVHFSHNSA
jgi:hypothetical protein